MFCKKAAAGGLDVNGVKTGLLRLALRRCIKYFFYSQQNTLGILFRVGHIDDNA